MRIETIYAHGARGRRLEARNDVEGHGLAGSVGADQSYDLSGMDREGHPVDRVERAEADPDVTQLERGGHRPP